jgi:hypothetical protein
MTLDECNMYESICENNTQPHRRGDDLFRGLLETNEHGIILMVKPPSKNFTSFEVWLFCNNLMINQHLRIIQSQNEALIRETKENISAVINEAQEILSEAKLIINSSPGKGTRIVLSVPCEHHV